MSLRTNSSTVAPSPYWFLVIGAAITTPIFPITNKSLFICLRPQIALQSWILEYITPTWVRRFNTWRFTLVVFFLNMNCYLLATCELASFKQTCCYLRVLGCGCVALYVNCLSVPPATPISLIRSWCRNCWNYFVQRRGSIVKI